MFTCSISNVVFTFRFVTPSLMGGVCFGAGLGITLFGIMYMFIHDGMVHRRFPVRPALLHSIVVYMHMSTHDGTVHRDPSDACTLLKDCGIYHQCGSHVVFQFVLSSYTVSSGKLCP